MGAALEIRPMEAAQALPRLRWRLAQGTDAGERMTAEEVPVALVHDGSTTAVMMASPADLEDFAVGFSLTEGLVASLADIRGVEVAASDLGVEVRMWLAPQRAAQVAARRRRLAGPTGCGLCGVESLAEASRPPQWIARALSAAPDELLAAMQALSDAQDLGRRTRAAHAAGFWAGGELVAVREDVGRHNALDKLVGALARQHLAPEGVVLLTSRVSVEMVQKTAAFGAPILCAVSAPTTLAVRAAEAAGLTLVAVARSDGLEVFTRPERLRLA
jgi:FdhD protein